MKVADISIIRSCAIAAGCMALWPAAAGTDEGVRHDYPTVARVEYVQSCVVENGGEAALLYKCSCVIDRIAQRLNFDEFVESSTYSRYATLAGEGGAIFRDSDYAKNMAKLYRDVQAEAYRACGFSPASAAAS